MKALVVSRLSPDLSGVALRETDRPQGEVLIRVRAASLNYPDLLMTQGKYQFKPEPPFVAGLEMAGEVVEARADSGFAAGDAVMGGAKTGAFADYVALPAASLRKIPHGLEAGQTVLVHGASGGVGLAACDLARALGAKVIAATHREDKIEALQRIARPDAVIVNTGRFRDDIAELTDGRLCDLVYDPIGGDVFDESTRCVAFGGKLLVIGFVSGRIPEIAVNIPLIKGFSVVGVRAGEYARRFPARGARVAEAIDELATGKRIAPHVDRVLPLDRWREAFDAMANGDIIGKLVLEP